MDGDEGRHAAVYIPEIDEVFEPQAGLFMTRDEADRTYTENFNLFRTVFRFISDHLSQKSTIETGSSDEKAETTSSEPEEYPYTWD